MAGGEPDRVPASLPAASGLVKLTSGEPDSRYRWTKVGQHLLTYGEFEKTYGRGDEVTVTQSRDFLWAAIMMMRLNH